MINSHSRQRVFSILPQFVLSLLFVTAGMGLSALMARAQDNPSNAQKKPTITLTTDPSPAQKGTNKVQVKLTDPTGQPISGAEVTVTFFMPAMPSMNMAAMKTVVKSTDKGAGMYEGQGIWVQVVCGRSQSQRGRTDRSSRPGCSALQPKGECNGNSRRSDGTNSPVLCDVEWNRPACLEFGLGGFISKWDRYTSRAFQVSGRAQMR